MVQILNHTRSVDNIVILAVVNHNPNAVQHNHHWVRISSSNISHKAVVNCIISRHIIDVRRNIEGSLVFLQELSESLVIITVFSEIVVVHSSQILLFNIIIVGQEIEILVGLCKRKATSWY